MKLIYMNHTINFVNLKGIDVIVPEGATIIECEEYVIFEN